MANGKTEAALSYFKQAYDGGNREAELIKAYYNLLILTGKKAFLEGQGFKAHGYFKTAKSLFPDDSLLNFYFRLTESDMMFSSADNTLPEEIRLKMSPSKENEVMLELINRYSIHPEWQKPAPALVFPVKEAVRPQESRETPAAAAVRSRRQVSIPPEPETNNRGIAEKTKNDRFQKSVRRTIILNLAAFVAAAVFSIMIFQHFFGQKRLAKMESALKTHEDIKFQKGSDDINDFVPPFQENVIRSKVNTARKLYEYDREVALKTFSEMTVSKDYTVRAVAAWVLAEIFRVEMDREVERLLLKLENDEVAYIRNCVSVSLKKFGLSGDKK